MRRIRREILIAALLLVPASAVNAQQPRAVTVFLNAGSPSKTLLTLAAAERFDLTDIIVVSIAGTPTAAVLNRNGAMRLVAPLGTTNFVTPIRFSGASEITVSCEGCFTNQGAMAVTISGELLRAP
jgi:hypothetical protein